MNRKQKILVSIFSIIILILIMVGFTYAYFVTNVKGNPNDTSIIMTSADLKLVYADGNGLVSATNIEPGDNIPEKTFTVTNTGSITIESYGIYFENVINTFSNNNDIVYSLTCTSSKSKSCNGISKQTFPDYNELLVINSIDKDEVQTYSLKVEYLDNGLDQSSDMNKSLSAKVQIYNISDVVNITGKVTNYSDGDYIEINNNKSQINKDGIYKIVGIPATTNTIYLKNSSNEVKGQKNIEINRITGVSSINSNIINVNSYGEIVNIDVNKLSNDIELNIKSIENYNKNISGTLVNSIFNNANSLNELNTKLVDTPSTTPGDEVSLSEAELIPSNDNYGVSYYYRGNVKDNFVNYNGMCFRISRIEGDGSIKLILADKDNICNNSNYSISNPSSSLIDLSIFGNKENNMPNFVNTLNNSLYYKLNSWFNLYFANEIHKLKSDTWCLGNIDKKYSESSYELTNDANYLYKNALRIKNNEPTFLCESDSKKYKGYVGSLTSDEVIFSGINDSTSGSSYILNNASSNSWWTISVSNYKNNMSYSYVVGNKLLSTDGITNNNYIRPVIILNSRIYASGSGIQNDPFIIK